MDLKNLFSRVIDLARSAISGPQAPEEREPPAEREQQALDEETRRRTAAGDLTAPSMDDEQVQVSVERGSTLAIRWNVTAPAMDRARMVLGEEGTLAVRVIVVTRTAWDVTSTPVEHAPVPAAGQTWLDEVSAGALCVVAVGLRSGDRFVSIAHAGPMQIG